MAWALRQAIEASCLSLTWLLLGHSCARWLFFILFYIRVVTHITKQYMYVGMQVLYM